MGVINEDNTIKGGTGWSAELGKQLHKKVIVYDQERRDWYSWVNNEWASTAELRITARRFAGGGS